MHQQNDLPTPARKSFWRRSFLLTALLLLWLPCIQFFFTPALHDYQQSNGIAPMTQKMAAYQLGLWTDPALRKKAMARMRGSNAEWDFMGRSFLVWSLANMALRKPENKKTYLAIMDRIIDETVRLEATKGMYFFLMPYARHRAFVMKPARSQFLDGEIALMMGLRRMVQERPSYRKHMKELVAMMAGRMQQSPILSLESYPDEVWTFCNTVSLAAIKVSDVLDGTDHRGLFHAWVAMAKKKLIHKPSGLLHSAYTLQGKVKQGPEGSTIWMSIHNLLLIDNGFAREQYALARKHLGRQLLGFGYAREWPPSWRGHMDIDSGVVIPVLGASPGSSGLALVAAAVVGDEAWLKQLMASLHLAAFPKETPTTLRFLASNQVGDAVMLYAMVQGPMWEKIKQARFLKPAKKAKAAKKTKGKRL